MEEFYNDLTYRISRLVTKSYSTSFSIAVSFLGREIRDAIYGIYGFVRFADEIVDTFHEREKRHLLEKFEADYYDAVRHGISLNPVLHSFQKVVRKYNIPDSHVQAFLNSMKADLHLSDYASNEEIGKYIYGSAEVVGLMCLRVFLYGNDELCNAFEEQARRLGAAFQKVNFLRDLKNDTEALGRRYFPEIVKNGLDEVVKGRIIEDIRNDFNLSYPGIRSLPVRARLGVLIAYKYYRSLLNKIEKTPADRLIKERIRVSNARKVTLLMEAWIINRLNIV